MRFNRGLAFDIVLGAANLGMMYMINSQGTEHQKSLDNYGKRFQIQMDSLTAKNRVLEGELQQLKTTRIINNTKTNEEIKSIDTKSPNELKSLFLSEYPRSPK